MFTASLASTLPISTPLSMTTPNVVRRHQMSLGVGDRSYIIEKPLEGLRGPRKKERQRKIVGKSEIGEKSIQTKGEVRAQRKIWVELGSEDLALVLGTLTESAVGAPGKSLPSPCLGVLICKMGTSQGYLQRASNCLL